jgi:hypothetical protein
MSILGIAGRYGPVRKIAQLTYQATCPVCLVTGALRVHITPAGELPRCRTCALDVLIAAIKSTPEAPDA